MLISKNILQSTGILIRLSMMPIKGNTLKPKPILIKFLSRILFDSSTNLVIVKPSPRFIAINANILKTTIRKIKWDVFKFLLGLI